jgi:hypothetical protein
MCWIGGINMAKYTDNMVAAYVAPMCAAMLRPYTHTHTHTNTSTHTHTHIHATHTHTHTHNTHTHTQSVERGAV